MRPQIVKKILIRLFFVTKRHRDVIRCYSILNCTPYDGDKMYSHTLVLQPLRPLTTYINYREMKDFIFVVIQAIFNIKKDKTILYFTSKGFQQREKVLWVY